MIRDSRLIFFPLVIMVLFLASYFLIRSSHRPETRPVPETELNQPPVLPPGPPPVWYVRFAVQGQRATYYTEHPQAPVSASARGYFLGSGAVHPRHALDKGGETREPIIPFGTILYLDRPVQVQNDWYHSLEVNDTGDVYYGLWPQYPYWVDIYAGPTNHHNLKSALEGGTALIDYHWYEPWR